MPHRRKIFLGLFVAGSLLGCVGKGEHEGTPDADAVAAGQPTPAGAAAPGTAAADACESYSKELCGKAGETSASCQSIKQLAGVLPPEACTAAAGNMAFTEKALEEMKSVCKTLVEKLCKDIGEDTQSCEMVRTQSARFQPEQCQSMMNEYDKVLGELKQMEERNKPLDEAKAKAIAEGDVPSFGPEDAAVTIVEFSDFQCPYCSRAADVVDQIKDKYGDKARFVFRQFPLSFHKDAHLAAQASLAAHEQGKFWEFHDKLFENQKALSREDLEKYAKEIGLDMAKFKKALDDKTYAAQVDKELEMGKDVAVSGTPTLFINGERVANATDFAAVSKQIDEALQKKQG